MYKFYGKHVLAEIYGVSFNLFSDINKIVRIIEQGIAQSGATLIKTVYCQFQPYGFTVISILKESHVSVHTYPERGSAFIDAFTCGDIAQPQLIVQNIIEYFNPKSSKIQTIIRGLKEDNFF